MRKILPFKTADILSLVQEAKETASVYLALTYDTKTISLTILPTTFATPSITLYPEGYHPDHDQDATAAAQALFGESFFKLAITLADYPNLMPDRLSLFLSKKLTQAILILHPNNAVTFTFTENYQDFIQRNRELVCLQIKANTNYNAQGHATFTKDNDPWAEDDE